MAVGDLTKLFSAGGDMPIDFGSATSGGPVSFGNITGPNTGGRSSEWLLNSNKNPLPFIGIGLFSLVVLAGVGFMVKGRK